MAEIFNNKVHCSLARRGHHGRLIVCFWAQTSYYWCKEDFGCKDEEPHSRWCNSNAKSWRQTNCNQANAVLMLLNEPDGNLKYLKPVINGNYHKGGTWYFDSNITIIFWNILILRRLFSFLCHFFCKNAALPEFSTCFLPLFTVLLVRKNKPN